MKYKRATREQEKLLGLLTRTPLEHLLPIAKTVTAAASEVICSSGRDAGCAWLVLQGACAWRAAQSHSVSQECFAFSRGAAFVDGRPEIDAKLVAIEDCVLLKVRWEDLQILAGDETESVFRGDESLAMEIPSLGGLSLMEPQLGRVICLAFFRSQFSVDNMQRSLASRIHEETRASVVLLQLANAKAPGPEGGAMDCLLGDVDSWMRSHPWECSACHVLRVGFPTESSAADGLRALMEMLRRRFNYVLVGLPAEELSGANLFSCVSQSDSTYFFVGSRPEAIDQMSLALRDLKPRLNSHYPVRLHAVVCLGQGESPRELADQVETTGIELSAYWRDVPDTSGRHGGLWKAEGGGLYGRDLRRLARAIGGCLVGLALSSGGVKGMAHVGVIQVLEENGLDVDIVAGSSMGAYIGALWAYGCNSAKLHELAMEMSTKGAIWRVLDPVFPPRQGFLRGQAVKRRLQRTIGNAHFAELVRPFRVVATDLDTLERAVFSSGEVAEAVHASAAVPGIVVPVRIGDRAFMDGGIVDPLPTGVLWEMGVRRILAVSTIPTTADIRRRLQTERRLAPAAQPRARKVGRAFPPLGDQINYFAQGNILDIFMHSIQGSQIRIAEPAFRQASLVLRPRLTDTRWLDFSITRKCVAAGRAVAEHHLDEIKTLLNPKGVPHELPTFESAVATTA